MPPAPTLGPHWGPRPGQGTCSSLKPSPARSTRSCGPRRAETLQLLHSSLRAPRQPCCPGLGVKLGRATSCSSGGQPFPPGSPCREQRLGLTPAQGGASRMGPGGLCGRQKVVQKHCPPQDRHAAWHLPVPWRAPRMPCAELSQPASSPAPSHPTLGQQRLPPQRFQGRGPKDSLFDAEMSKVS